MSEAAIEIRDVSRSFGRIRALDGVSFDVGRQSICGLLGPNGAGKTTLFSIIANFIRADRGTVRVLGIDVQQISKLQGRLTTLPQDALFQRNVPLIEQLVFFLRLNGKSRWDARDEVRRTLEMVGLGKYMKRRVSSLSHGMIKRLGIAQAFLADPEVILLDEPTSGLDPANASHIRGLVRKLRERATVVVSSHNLSEIQDLCDQVAILDRGRLVAVGPVAEITRAGKQIDLRLSQELSTEEQAELASIPGVGEVRSLGAARYAFSLDLATSGSAGEAQDPDAVLAELLRAILDRGRVPRELREGRTLEEHFLKLTGGKGA